MLSDTEKSCIAYDIWDTDCEKTFTRIDTCLTTLYYDVHQAHLREFKAIYAKMWQAFLKELGVFFLFDMACMSFVAFVIRALGSQELPSPLNILWVPIVACLLLCASHMNSFYEHLKIRKAWLSIQKHKRMPQTNSLKEQANILCDILKEYQLRMCVTEEFKSRVHENLLRIHKVK